MSNGPLGHFPVITKCRNWARRTPVKMLFIFYDMCVPRALVKFLASLTSLVYFTILLSSAAFYFLVSSSTAFVRTQICTYLPLPTSRSTIVRIFGRRECDPMIAHQLTRSSKIKFYSLWTANTENTRTVADYSRAGTTDVTAIGNNSTRLRICRLELRFVQTWLVLSEILAVTSIRWRTFSFWFTQRHLREPNKKTMQNPR